MMICLYIEESRLVLLTNSFNYRNHYISLIDTTIPCLYQVLLVYKLCLNFILRFCYGNPRTSINCPVYSCTHYGLLQG